MARTCMLAMILVCALILGAALVPAHASEGQWAVNVQLDGPAAALGDPATYLGVKPDATDDYDPTDAPNPPAPPHEDYVDLYFYRPTWPVQSDWSQDWRSVLAAGTSKIWGDIRALSTVAGQHVLSWTLAIPDWEPPTSYWFWLFDEGDSPNPTAGTPYNMRTQSSLTFYHSGAGSRHYFHIVVYTEEKHSPTCAFTWAPLEPIQGESVGFDGTASSDPDGTVVAWDWNFGDGGTAAGVQVSHIYASGGDYTVTLRVTDDEGASSSCTAVITIAPGVVEVSIPLSEGWHMIALPLEPVNKTILLDRQTGLEDPESIFYTAWEQGNDPRMRLFRMEPGVGYWVYNPDLYPCESWYDIGLGPPAGEPPAYCDNTTYPDPGPWWQGFWFLVEVPGGITLSYQGYLPPGDPMARYLDINTNYDPGTFTWAWMMMGACARVPASPPPYVADGDPMNWPLTSMVTDLMWGKSTPPTEPTIWLPTSHCTDPSAWYSSYIGLPVIGYEPGGYYSVSPASGEPYCGAPTLPFRDSLMPGEGYWLDVEDPEVWLKAYPNQWP